MHRKKLHEDTSATVSPEEFSSKRHLDNAYSFGDVNHGIGLHPRPDDDGCQSSEDKRSEHLDCKTNETEPTNKVNRPPHGASSIVKDEEPSSVTSSGCSPPVNSDSTSPKRDSTRNMEESKNVSNHHEDHIKPEPSSTKGNMGQISVHDDDSCLSIRPVNNPANPVCIRKEEKQGRFINYMK